MPTLEIENNYTGHIVCGVDEVGRGCLAGDVYACAVILPENFPGDIMKQLHDSKKLTSKKREYLSEQIKKHAIYSVGIATVKEIDSINILHAALLAMKRAVESLSIRPDVCLVDGNKEPDLPEYMVKTVINGDSLSCSIAAASIVAKVERDAKMAELAEKYPYYAWERNAGYGTKAHISGLLKHGITEWHRQSFSPVKNAKKLD